MDEYDEICSKCAGSGSIGDDDEACDQCSGYGYKLTGKGHYLVEFLKRRGFNQSMSPEAEDELRGMVER